MDIQGKSIFLTGATGGIGSNLLEELLKRGASKVYAADINREKLDALRGIYGDKVVPLFLDVTNDENINYCVGLCNNIGNGVDILINNAGVEFCASFIGDKATSAASIEIAVNYLGVHKLCYSFWNILEQKPSSAIINILSVGSFTLILKIGTYCASKAAADVLTQGLRAESEGTSIKVFGVYPGYVDTDMITDMDVEKACPKEVAYRICDDVEKDILDIFPDQMSQKLKELRRMAEL